ncbi:hypothetical protein BO78DRAFT_364492 [Aspergillus sclerotiicarbonarius CBS 121057]|uniref:Zn(2)-C6 fungal-type domain-containing protein n=1 Tax=Aspergillus sclerotiicarbonarius (strain CBS 121057 / IBT 28362) TaxID=1448318 RepID=A0A319F0V0_ASPSB|nr:hypothetical protein BO78DRAFT_364492 [Aspergillus sclerotiicarbonarius CBS 121057]
MASTGPREVRGKTRQRSRFGCRNCKLRKLKCDEAKPQCKRCRSFGLLCTFMSNIPDLQPVAAERGRPLAVRPPPTNAVWTSDASTSYQLNARSQGFITRYLGQGLITPDGSNMIQVNRKLLELAFTYPFLMHASLAVALTYDRHLNGSGCRRTLEECYHWSRATVLLNKRLREPIETKDKDPIWGTAAALVILTFSSDAYTPEQAWPLKSSDSDLDWLRLSKSKMLLWHTVNPLRPDSLFHVMAATFAEMQSPLPERGIDGIPTALAAVCNLTDSSTAETNPYFHAAHAVSQTLDLPEITTGQSQVFMRCIHGSFEDLLWKRDPVALLLLYLWYCKASHSIWWIELRARVECPSICLYLQRYHQENDAIQSFLPQGALAHVLSWNS